MTIRTVTYIGVVALLSQVLLVHGCGSNNPSTDNTGGTTAAANTTAATPAGGTTASANTTAATPTGGTIAAVNTTAATPTGGTTGAAGAVATTPAGGATAAAGARASTPTGGAPAAAGTTGATGAAGTAGAAGASGTSSYQPLCKGLVTVGGAEPAKLVACADADPQLCYKTCGPKSIGFKSETCTGGSYQEQTGCDFLPGVDYSCYKIPAAVDPTCPTTTPQASQPCSVADCVLCNVADSYLDSTGASKAGYCVCPTPSSATATSKWSCASTSAWPCPSRQGC
jgi:hypothetical protein